MKEQDKITKILKYIKRQNFDGAYAYLKKNIVRYINEVLEEDLNNIGGKTK